MGQRVAKMTGSIAGYMIESDKKGNIPKEVMEMLKYDYRHTGKFWVYHGKFYQWMKSIDNKFMRQKIEWVEQDILDGFGNFYYCEVFYQNNIERPWINDVCLKYISNDHIVNFSHTEISSNEDFYFFIIKRSDYKNIYSPIEMMDSMDMQRKTGMAIYDPRIDELNTRLEKNGKTLLQAWNECREELDNQAKIRWGYLLDDYNKRVKNLTTFIRNKKSVNSDKNQFIEIEESWNDMGLDNFTHSSFVYKGVLYFDNFIYQEILSDKNFKVFTKSIDDNYQWAFVLFAFGSKIQMWSGCEPLLLIVKKNQNRPIKPKDVIYQENYLFLRHKLIFDIKSSRSEILQIQRFVYFGRYINRYIDYMQDKIMAVIYDK